MASLMEPVLAELAFAQGFFTGGGLIIAIGAQNAFVLKQGLQRQFPGSIAATCFAVDAMLIAAGIAGMGVLVQGHPVLLQMITLAGALFLTGYGIRALGAVRAAQAITLATTVSQQRGKAIVVTLVLSLLNPHVYLDTVVLLGGIGGALDKPANLWFGAGAILASFIWFFSLAFGAARLAPLLGTAKAWQILHTAIAIVMFVIAVGLWWRFFALTFGSV